MDIGPCVHIVLLTGLLGLGFVPAPAQTLTAGGRATALGFATATLAPEPTFSANAAGPAALTKPVLSATVRRPFGLAALQTAQVSYAGPVGGRPMTFGLHTFGFSAYREVHLRMGLAHRFRPGLDLGAQVLGYVLRIPGYGSARTWGLSVGGLLRPTPTVQIGFQAVNLNRPAWAGTEPLPRRLALGLAYRPTPHTCVVLDVHKAARFPASARGGLELQPVPALALRTGFATAPHRFTAGFGLHWHGTRIDAAAARHPYLGWTPVLTVHTALR